MKPQFNRKLRVFGITILLCALATPCVNAKAKNSDRYAEDHNKQLVLKSFDAWKSGSGSPFDLLAENASWTIAGNSVVSRTYNSRKEFIVQVIRPFNARMSVPLKPEIRNIYADGNTVIVYFDAEGTARDGKPYRNTYAWFFDFKNGKVIRAVALFDSLEFNDFWTRVRPVSDSIQK
jgi:hypothetical protein